MHYFSQPKFDPSLVRRLLGLDGTDTSYIIRGNPSEVHRLVSLLAREGGISDGEMQSLGYKLCDQAETSSSVKLEKE